MLTAIVVVTKRVMIVPKIIIDGLERFPVLSVEFAVGFCLGSSGTGLEVKERRRFGALATFSLEVSVDYMSLC